MTRSYCLDFHDDTIYMDRRRQRRRVNRPEV